MYNVVSLFSGCGGLDLGFVQQGFNIVWALDFDKAAVNTYKQNLGDHIICDDIKNINLKNIPDCDLVIGGSPCQGFSNANRYTNFLDNPKNFLVREYIKVVKEKQPKVFVLENVPQILTTGNGAFKDEILKALHEYDIEIKVLNAADYGVPQVRKRAIFIGSRIGTIYHPERKVHKYKTVGEGFCNLNDETPNQQEYRISRQDTIDKIKMIPQGGNWRTIPSLKENKNYHSSLYKRLHPDLPSITLTHAGKNVIIHPELDRILTIRECARIQGFPDDFIFTGTLNEKYQQLANAVPVNLGAAIAQQIKIHMGITTTYKQVI